MHNAQRILEGDIPYRDFFAIFPPMDNYYFALIFKLFGESVLIPRIISSIIFSFTPVLIFLICKRFAPTKLSTIPAILITFSDVNIERLYIFTPIFLGVYLYLQAVNRKKKWLFGWSGFMLGLSSLIRLDIPGTFANEFANVPGQDSVSPGLSATTSRPFMSLVSSRSCSGLPVSAGKVP